MLGDVKINYMEKPYRVLNDNYRNIIALVAPFKDDTWVFKSYNTLQEAIDGEKTLEPKALGYHYLKEVLGKNFTGIQEIVLCNTTTKEGAEYNYEMTNGQFAEILEELDEVGISFPVIPEKLTVPQYVMFKKFWDVQKRKMNRFGLIHQVKPTEKVTTDKTGATISETSLLEVLFSKVELNVDEDGYTYAELVGDPGVFYNGGSWLAVTTPIKLVGEPPMSIEDSVVYMAGVVATTPENLSLTHYILDDVEGLITKQQYGKKAFNLVNNTGAIALNYRDRIHDVVQVYNAGTMTWNKQIKNTLDLKHERTHALIVNEFKIGLLKLVAGKSNNKITYNDFDSLGRHIEETYKPDYINGLEWSINKSGMGRVRVVMKDKQSDIIKIIDVEGYQIIE